AQLYSTASYLAHDLSGIKLESNDLTNWNFANQNLSGALFLHATLTGTVLTGADVRGASFEGTADSGFTAAQLYSTASYQAHDLTGIRLGYYNNLSGWNFAGQNLANASFGSAMLTNANLRAADMRGADFYPGTLDGANTGNLIQSNGHIA